MVYLSILTVIGASLVVFGLAVYAGSRIEDLLIEHKWHDKLF